jgi:WD40 repeat protein
VLSDGNLLAVGCSNGFVSVFRADETLTKVIAKSCHDDYPVTGIAFSSSSAAKNENSDCFFVTCSADNRMASVVVRRSKLLLLAIFLLVVFLLWAISCKHSQC